MECAHRDRDRRTACLRFRVDSRHVDLQPTLSLDNPPPKMMPTHTDKSSAIASVGHHSQPHKYRITDFTITIPGSERKATDEPPKSRWRTPEFYFYYLAFSFVVPTMIYIPVKLSDCKSPRWLTADRQIGMPTISTTPTFSLQDGCTVEGSMSATCSFGRSAVMSAR